jgi:hypothetical protein
MGAGDLFGDLGERRIIQPGIFEAVFRHRYGVGAALPFAHQPGTGLEAKPWIRSDPAFGAKHLCQRLQLALCGSAETAMLKLLKAVADPAHQ